MTATSAHPEIRARVRPTLEGFFAVERESTRTHVPLVLTLAADTETPVGLFHKLAGARPGSFLLESAHASGRWSFVGFDVARTITTAEGGLDPLELVAQELARTTLHVAHDARELPPFLGGAVGFVGYDAVRAFEHVPLAATRTLDIPEAALFVTDELAAFDHLRGLLHLIVLAPLGGDRARTYDRTLARLAALEARLETPGPRPRTHRPAPPLPRTQSRTSQSAFEQAVRRAQAAIEAGEIFQVVLSQRHTVEASVEPLALYRALRALNPSPYMFLLRFATHAVVGASPETLVQVTRATDEASARPGEDAPLVARVRPIAGTRPRGATPREDSELARELALDEKELAEHRMLLDLGRNDVGRVAKLGSVRVERERAIERYSHVMHLVSDVSGTLAPGKTALDAFRAAFPAGTVSGAPKIRAMELIAALEPERRGLYAGAVGYFGFDGQSDTCIAIRTVLVEPHRCHVQAGAGIVLDSVPALEHAECLAKARGPLTAIAMALEDCQGSALRDTETSSAPPASALPEPELSSSQVTS
jgi:anthranilate synthase component 1